MIKCESASSAQASKITEEAKHHSSSTSGCLMNLKLFEETPLDKENKGKLHF